jgi:predicted aldo/keto reductase-like oxidoreductase
MGAIRAEMGDEWCHRCDYCQPCPKGIPISSVLIAKGAAKRMTKEAAAAFLEPSMRLAEECIECGQCASRCPYKLDIPALLKRNISSWKRFKETGIFG